MKKKCSVQDFQHYKDIGQKWTWSICYDYTMAGIVDESKTEMIHHIHSVVKGAPNTFIVGDMPFGTYNVSDEQAVQTANRIMQEGGSDCVKLEGGANMAPRIKAIVNAGIPVLAHIGLTPQSISALGGFKVQGKSTEVADKLVADAVAVTEAGAFAICLECIPSVVAKRISETVKIPCIGIGAGPYVAGQELNLYDMTGLFGDFKPKFVKQYAQLRQPIVDALNEFYDETCSGAFPTPEFCYNAKVEGY